MKSKYIFLHQVFLDCLKLTNNGGQDLLRLLGGEGGEAHDAATGPRPAGLVEGLVQGGFGDALGEGRGVLS